MLYLAGSFVTIYFNSALVAAAYAHLRGDEVSTGSAIAVANAHLPSIFGWACFATTVGLILTLSAATIVSSAGSSPLSSAVSGPI